MAFSVVAVLVEVICDLIDVTNEDPVLDDPIRVADDALPIFGNRYYRAIRSPYEGVTDSSPWLKRQPRDVPIVVKAVDEGAGGACVESGVIAAEIANEA